MFSQNLRETQMNLTVIVDCEINIRQLNLFQIPLLFFLITDLGSIILFAVEQN